LKYLFLQPFEPNIVAKKYRYNTRTLSYEKIELTFKDRFVKFLSFTLTGLVFAVFFIFITSLFFDSPKEKKLKRENQYLSFQYDLLSERLEQIEIVLEDLQKRDDNIYRVIFESEPIPKNIRKAGFGGINRYKEIEGYDYSGLVVSTTQKLDIISKQLYIQSKSFDEVFSLAKTKEDMMASIPSIQPINNVDLTRIASGFGMRIHPILKLSMMHTGQDFTASVGTEIYATGNGVVEEISFDQRGGYGNHIIINHGYGYQTLYAHMSKFNVKRGQKVKRGEVIGYVGNTGRSTGPHLHYEVIRNGAKVNPVNFYFNELSPQQYDEMVKLSSSPSQSFD
jgi:murein DD-endopeptidase MepM/ murein hydrolase activator NlpD